MFDYELVIYTSYLPKMKEEQVIRYVVLSFCVIYTAQFFCIRDLCVLNKTGKI